MDAAGVIEALGEAIPLQFRSAIQFAVAAASVGGLEHIALADKLFGFAQAELVDARSLVEKLVAIGGDPPHEVASWSSSTDAVEAVKGLIEGETETLAALHAIIPLTGQEPRSEALEHLVEHLLIRKQRQVDDLLRALGQTE
jgi:bacterioferritin (cytochrome b1)